MKVNVIVTYSNNLVIGNDNTIPWNYTETIEYFDLITLFEQNMSDRKNIIICGYNTYKLFSFNNRIKIVITSKKKEDYNIYDDNLFFVDSIGSAMEYARNLIDKKIGNKIFISGGESIYKYFFTSFFYRYLDKVYITYINKDFDGNKFFYGLENKFTYVSIEKSNKSFEIEYRVLQYDKYLINAEDIYLDYLKELIKLNSDQNEQCFDLHIEIDLLKYFPVFTVVKTYINKIISDQLLFINSIKNKIDIIINKIRESIENKVLFTVQLDLYDIEPLESIYTFNIENSIISCIVDQKRGNILKGIIYNIIFSSLLTHLIAKITGIIPSLIDYNCQDAYIYKNQLIEIETIIWNQPDILPIIEIKNKDNIEDFKLEDITFLGDIKQEVNLDSFLV